MSRRVIISMPGAPKPQTSHLEWVGEVEVEIFPDGESAITNPLVTSQDHVVLVGGCHTAEASETFLAAAYEVAQSGPSSFTILNTYFRHARCDKRFGRQAVMAKFQARLWSGVGTIYPGVRLVFVDLHNDLILNYFEGAVRTVNRRLLPTIEKTILEQIRFKHKLVYGSVDVGGLHDVKTMAAYRTNVGVAHIDKKRLSGTETIIRKIVGDVKGKDVIIFDDMTSTGGSAVKAAEAYRDRGAKKIVLGLSHGVFAKGALKRLRDSPISKVYVTDSHPNAVKAAKKAPDFVVLVGLIPDKLAPFQDSQ